MAELKDYGLQYVNPDLVEVSPPVRKGWETTRDGGGGVSRDQIRSGIDNAKEVRTRLDQGYTDDDFRRLRESSDLHDKAVSDSQAMLWGDRPITVTKNGDRFSTDNGRHRIDAAQAAGTRSLPMRVYAPEDDPQFSTRDYDYARSHGTEPQEEVSMGEQSRSRQEHNPIETPELSRSPEVSHVDPMTPETHEQFHNDTSKSARDPMDGQTTGHTTRDQMDGGEKTPKPTDALGKEAMKIDPREAHE